MALTGIVLIGFVFVHMLGNPDPSWAGIDKCLRTCSPKSSFAHSLGFPGFSFVCVFLHALTAYLLIKENRAARPVPNEVEKTKRAGWSSLRMGLTGSIILAFVVFHLLHFTTRQIFPNTVSLKL